MTSLPGYPCATCGRQSQGFTATVPQVGFFQFCTMECVMTFMKNGPATHDERKAALIGGDAGGEYLDKIGKTNLASLTPAEWEEFCSLIFTGACAELKRQADDEIPF